MWQARTNFGIDQDTSKFMFLVCFLDLKFARRPTPRTGELQIQHTSAWRRQPSGDIVADRPDDEAATPRLKGDVIGPWGLTALVIGITSPAIGLYAMWGPIEA